MVGQGPVPILNMSITLGVVDLAVDVAQGFSQARAERQWSSD